MGDSDDSGEAADGADANELDMDDIDGSGSGSGLGEVAETIIEAVEKAATEIVNATQVSTVDIASVVSKLTWPYLCCYLGYS